MAKKQKQNNRGIITVGGNLTLPGQKRPNVIVLTQPKRFGIDIADYMPSEPPRTWTIQGVTSYMTCMPTFSWTRTSPA